MYTCKYIDTEIMYIMHAATEYAPTCSVCSLFWALSMHQHVAKFMQGYESVLFEVSLSGRMSGEAKITMNPQG